MTEHVTATQRIRWEPSGEGGLTGHAGIIQPWLFGIWTPEDCGGEQWALTCNLPGMTKRRANGDSGDALKATAETWLREFVASLGAVFPDGEG